jgi:hypothetical protein
VRLVTEEGAVRGVVIDREGKLMTVRARRGIVLASGGFGGERRTQGQIYALSRRAYFGAAGRKRGRRNPARAEGRGCARQAKPRKWRVGTGFSDPSQGRVYRQISALRPGPR